MTMPDDTSLLSMEGAEGMHSGDQVRPLSRVRRIIASRMMESLHGSAQLTSVVEVDLTQVMALRRDSGEALRARHGVGVGPLPVLAWAVCAALHDHPMLNATIDVEAGLATYRGVVNLGVAVDTSAGLMVPNIKGANQLGVVDLARALADLADRSRGRALTPDDVSDGTFTITNTGSRGSLLDTPILNTPEVGILAVGKAQRRPIVVTRDGREEVAVRDMSYLCLTYDHRLVDGADAARFLVDVTRRVETADLRDELGLADG